MGTIFRKLIDAFLPGTIEVGEAADRVRDDLSRQMAEASHAGAEVDALAADAGATLDRCHEMNPAAFDRRRNRRVGDARTTDAPDASGLDVTEYRFDGLQRGNADLSGENDEGGAA